MGQPVPVGGKRLELFISQRLVLYTSNGRRLCSERIAPILVVLSLFLELSITPSITV